MKIRTEILNMGQRVPVVFRGVVEAAEITAGPPGPIGLGHHVEGRRPRAVRPTDDAILEQLVKSLPSAGKSLRTETPRLRENGSSAGGHQVRNAMRVAVRAESWLLDLRKLRKEVLIFARGLDDLKGGARRIRFGEGGRDRVYHLVVHELEDPLAFEVHAQVVGVKEIGAEQGARNVGQDELVAEGDVGKI